MSKEIIATLLEWNPWFNDGDISELTGFHREYDILSYLSIPEIKILEGIRRSGKSTLLYQIVNYGKQQGKKVLYVNFEDEILSKFPLADIFYAFLQYSKVDYLLIDEVQQCINWVPFIRKYYDRKELEQIWITGSNSSLIKQEYSEALTGRNIKLAIAPLSFREYLTFKGITKVRYPVSKNDESQIKKWFDIYMNLGAFPGIALRSIYQRELLNNYFEDIVYKDIASRYDVNISKLKDLAIYFITNSTKLYSYRKIANLLGLHPHTVMEYVTYLKEVLLFDEIHKFDYSLGKQLSYDKKIYVIDTGLANAVSFRFSEDKGRMLETIVYRQLKRMRKEIYFYRDKYECDFVIKEDLTITQVIQVTTTLAEMKTKTRELAGLKSALETYKLKTGLILTLDEEGFETMVIDDKECSITIMPVWAWLLQE